MTDDEILALATRHGVVSYAGRWRQLVAFAREMARNPDTAQLDWLCEHIHSLVPRSGELPAISCDRVTIDAAMARQA